MHERIKKEENIFIENVNILFDAWQKRRPVGSDLNALSSLKTLKEFELKFISLEKDYELIVKANEVLEMPKIKNEMLKNMVEEHFDLKDVWSCLYDNSAHLEAIKSIKWNSEESWTVKTKLQKLLVELKQASNKIRHYPPYEAFRELVESCIKKHSKISILKSESLRKRHWDKIIYILELTNLSSDDLTVSQLWNAPKLSENSKAIDEILSSAQGELTIENFLSATRNYWASCSLNFTHFRNKCRLVKGWDELFGKAEEHLNSISAMKNSAHFTSFKEECSNIEDMLTKLYSLITVWVSVQRQWVYLEGIFCGNDEIKQILPFESNRFTSVDAEFIGMLRKVYKSPLIMDVISITNIQKTMDRLASLLLNIQKSLGDYLERERNNFPRFYFLGDEDLLEILGSGKNMDRVRPHFKKMFGFSDIEMNEMEITHIVSSEGEIVTLNI